MKNKRKAERQRHDRHITGIALLLAAFVLAGFISAKPAYAAAFTSVRIYDNGTRAERPNAESRKAEADSRRQDAESRRDWAEARQIESGSLRVETEPQWRDAGSLKSEAESRRPEQNRNTNTSITQPENNIPLERRSDQKREQQTEKNIHIAQNENADWMLVLVNAWNPMPDNYSPKLKSLSNGLQFDERAISQLNDMLAAAKNQGLSPIVCSAYRTIETQRTLFKNKVSQLIASGLSLSHAEYEAQRHVAYPGASEHNLGLAVDIVSENYQLLDEKQANTPEAKWLREHCAEYGFILRYQKGKEAVTGIVYEPWHFRYVGVAAAWDIMVSGLCLEEYLSE